MFTYFRKKHKKQDLLNRIAAYQKAQDELCICMEKMRKKGINASARAFIIVNDEWAEIASQQLTLENELLNL